MMFSKFTALAVLAVTLLAVSTHGRPEFDSTVSREEHGSHNWLGSVLRNVHNRVNSYRHINGGVFEWAKHKLGLDKTGGNTAATTTTTTTTTIPEAAKTTEAVPETKSVVAPIVPKMPKLNTASKESPETAPEPKAPLPTGTEYHDADQEADDENDEDDKNATPQSTAGAGSEEEDHNSSINSDKKLKQIAGQDADENAAASAEQDKQNAVTGDDDGDDGNEDNEDIDPRSKLH